MLLLPCAISKENKNDTKYEWDDWDYYEILGLDRNAEYSEKEIKKAYRKQAQQWHPDKILDKTNTTKHQESNDRFARITEAYRILSKKKPEYDNYLQKRKNSYSHTAPTNGGDYYDGMYTASRHFYEPVDPWAIFEAFFGDLHSNIYSRGEPLYQNGYAGDAYGSYTFQTGNRSPDRFFEDEEYYFVDNYGHTVLRKTQTASYFDKDQGYFQIVAQEYAPRPQDLYTGELLYQPLHTEPVVLQEGIFEFVDDNFQTENDPNFIPRFMDPSSLWPGVSLVKGSKMNKGSYFVELSSDCDLASYREGISGEDESQLIWSLRESGQLPYYVNAANDCRVELQAGQLFLYIANDVNSILWASKFDLEEDHEYSQTDPRSDTYVARLDTDGALAVYRMQAIIIRRLWILSIWEKTILTTVPSSVASNIFELLWSFALGRRIRRTSSADVTSETCIVAVGSPVGCFRVGRRIVQLFRDAKAFVERVFSFVDRLLDMI